MDGSSLLAVVPVGQDLHRPECVLGSPGGDVYVSDWRGGVGVVRADGSQQAWLAQDAPFPLKTNGFAFDSAGGGFLIANLGDEGGVWRLGLDGGVEPFLTELHGEPLPPANFVHVDAAGRTWITVSTRHRPRQEAWRPDVRDGCVVLVEDGRACVAADGLHYTNEARVDPSGRWLYVVETFGRRVVRFEIGAGAALKEPQTVVDLPHGWFPDGLEFDAEGGLWLTSLISNRLARLFPEGRLELVVEDADAARTEEAEGAFRSGRMVAAHLGPMPGARFQHLTSLCFGGPDLRTVWLGSLHADQLHRFMADVPGARPPHWGYALP